MGRSRFRLFYSLHSAVQETRDILIPRATVLKAALPVLLEWSNGNRQNLIFHHLLVSSVNDTPAEIAALENLISIYTLEPYELRLLRYNGCGLSPYEESPDFENLANRLNSKMHVKVQTSLGSEVRAACGQFIVRDYDELSEIGPIASLSAKFNQEHSAF